MGKVFDQGDAQASRSFAIGGRTNLGVPWREEFACVGDLPAGVILDTMTGGESAGVASLTAGASDEDKAKAAAADAFSRQAELLIRTVILPEDQHRFRALLSDPVRIVKPGFLGDWIEWVWEEYGARPTPPQPASDGGLRTEATTSTAAGLVPPVPVLPAPATA